MTLAHAQVELKLLSLASLNEDRLGKQLCTHQRKLAPKHMTKHGKSILV
jgi:hypothetical protein